MTTQFDALGMVIDRLTDSFLNSESARQVREMAERLREMNAAEIRSAWEELPRVEAFEFFEGERYVLDDIKAALGQEVADEYARWTYLTQK